MISEGSCDTEDGIKFSFTITVIHYILKLHLTVFTVKHFYEIYAALVRIRDFICNMHIYSFWDNRKKQMSTIRFQILSNMKILNDI